MCESIDACPPRLDSSLAKSTLAVWIVVDAQTTLERRWMLRRNGLHHSLLNSDPRKGLSGVG